MGGAGLLSLIMHGYRKLTLHAEHLARQFVSYGMLLTGHKMSRKIRSDSDLRKRVEEILNCPIAPWAWKIAVMERAVSEVLKGENNPEWLAAMVT